MAEANERIMVLTAELARARETRKLKSVEYGEATRAAKEQANIVWALETLLARNGEEVGRG